MKYKRITERTKKPLTMSMWPGDSESLKIYNRLAELEDKIESGELISTKEVGDTEIEFFVKHNAEVRKQAVKEFAASVKLAFYYEFDELIPSVMADKIDTLVKEECGKEKSND